ncbi:hypothetical protein [Burkholderia multivorans]|uniref:hypothetical protein n=1 Tax=Burkholderia multivorans TaxID=87883 RepID=UPI0011B1D33F|nr:hypothetical protein [Burkholderia multivorans]MBY4791649.1 hypothetical protein [Burkholderia multivorans]
MITDPSIRRRYQRLCTGLALYLQYQPLASVEAVTGLSRSRFLRLVSRCLAPAPDGRIWGLRACVRGTRLQPLQRKKPISYQADPRAGFQGAFHKLLVDHPKIEQLLISELAGSGIKHLQPNRLALRGIQRAFLRICCEQGIQASDYPFCTKAKGSRALRKWVNETLMVQHGERWVTREYGASAGQAYGYQQGDGQSARLPKPYEAWELDEATIDVEAIYELPNAGGDWEEIELRRSFVIRVLDIGSGAKLANRLVLAPQASAEDVAILFWDAVNGVTFNAEAVSAGLLEPGAGYPATMIPALRFAVPRIVYLDNALAHLADHVQHLISGLWGAKIKLGRPGTPQERPHIEADFSAQARRLIHQLPGTTGSGPDDPLRESAAVGIKDRVPVYKLAEALDGYCANANILPAAAAGYIAPLERLRRNLACGALAPIYLPADKRRPHYFGKPCPVTVKVDLRNGRRPYVNFLSVRYSSDQLRRNVGLKDRRMWVRSDFRDLRTVLLFDDSGKEFDTLHALGRWGRFPHDVRIRKLYERLKRDGALGPRADDRPLASLLACLESRAVGNRTAALQLAYLLEYLKARPCADWGGNVDAADDLTISEDDAAPIPVSTTPPEPRVPLPRRARSVDSNDVDAGDLFATKLVPRRVIR